MTPHPYSTPQFAQNRAGRRAGQRLGQANLNRVMIYAELPLAKWMERIESQR